MSEDVWDRLEKEVKDPKMRERFAVSAGFRMGVADFKKHDTTFCKRCGWRTNGVSALCYDCTYCNQCQFPNVRCHCKSKRYLKHLQDLLDGK